MSKKPLYILTENLNFYYRLNRELDRKNIEYQILNIRGKIPNYPCIILTTSNETESIRPNNQVIILPYSDKEEFKLYILKILAAIRIKFKTFYSKVIFSIDPGTKYLGIAVFLDDYYLDSHTLFSIEDLLSYIKSVINAFQSENPNSLQLIFKIGKGVIDHTYNIINRLFNSIMGEENIQVYLVDEVSSSKIRLSSLKFPKHETAAIMLSFRIGLEINRSNYKTIFRRLRQKKIDYKEFRSKNYRILDNDTLNYVEIAEEIIKGKLSLSKVSEMVDRTYL